MNTWLTSGIGWFRIRTDYAVERPEQPDDEATFDQELRLERITNNGPTLTINRLAVPVQQVLNAAPLPIDGKALLALGAAAVIANPEPVSRRSILGLGGWRRHAR